MTVADVQKYLDLANELVSVLVLVLPEGKVKDYVGKGKALLGSPTLAEAVVVGFKLKDEVVALLNK